MQTNIRPCRPIQSLMGLHKPGMSQPLGRSDFSLCWHIDHLDTSHIVIDLRWNKFFSVTSFVLLFMESLNQIFRCDQMLLFCCCTANLLDWWTPCTETISHYVYVDGRAIKYSPVMEACSCSTSSPTWAVTFITELSYSNRCKMKVQNSFQLHVLDDKEYLGFLCFSAIRNSSN